MKETGNNTKVVYLGFNNLLKHKRGVENVIDFQSRAGFSKINYYVHWDEKTSIYRYKNFLCIGIKSNFYKFFVLNWFLFKIKKRDRAIFIHSHNALMSMFSIFQTHLFTVHDALYYQNKAINHKLKRIFYLLELYLYRRVNYVHFISEYAKKMSLFKGADRFIIIPNTSHLEGFKEMSNDIKDDKSLVKFSDTSIKVFVVRSFEERSRIDLLIQTGTELKNTNFEFFIAGKGPLYDFYCDQVDKLKLKNMKLLGYVNDLNLIDYYRNCDIVLMSAEYGEGFGLPIIEGYLFNKPVIASNKCAIPEVIISDSFLFDNTVSSIIEKLELAKLKLHGSYKNFYDKNFSNALVLRRFNHLYKNLM